MIDLEFSAFVFARETVIMIIITVTCIVSQKCISFVAQKEKSARVSFS